MCMSQASRDPAVDCTCPATVITCFRPPTVHRLFRSARAVQVLGYAAVTVDSPPTPGQYDASLPVVYVGTVAAQPWLSRFNLTGAGCTAGTEAHCLLVTHDAAVQGAAAGSMAVVATGNDMRGAIFGLYALSEEVLGVDPWYMWTDHEPAYVGQVQVPVGTTAFPVPAFEYRGWFTNDEDLNGYVRACV